MPLLIVDGSTPDRFDLHDKCWARFATHIAPAPAERCANGKAWGVRTGLRMTAATWVVIADDDVRYDAESLSAMQQALESGADLVRPQNYFAPLPWHAAWDTARSLLNRALSSDHPGTLGVARDAYRAAGGYDGDVLFENLQLVRTIDAAGGRVLDRPDLFVSRRPPTFERFLSQRIRQAYDDLAQPSRFILFLAIAPLCGVLASWRLPALAVPALATMALAEVGRRRHHMSAVVPPWVPLLAPAWMLERAFCSWLALGLRVVVGGCPYAGTVIRRAADPVRRLRRQHERERAGLFDGSRRTAAPASIDRTGRER